MKTTAPLPALARTDHPVAVVGGSNVGVAVRDIVEHAQRTLDMSAFRMSLAPTLDAVAAAHARGVDVNVLADTQNLDAAKGAYTRAALTASASEFREYGADPYKQHSKSVGRDGEDAMIASDVSDAKSPTRMEFGVRFGGRAAADYDALHHVDAHTSDKRAEAVYARAAADGILINDPQHDVWSMSKGVKSLLDAAHGQLLVVTKALESRDIVGRMADAAKRGVPTTIVTNSIASDLYTKLTHAGAAVKLLPWGSTKLPINVHGTMIATAGQAIVGSLPLIPRAIKGNDHRASRELGVVVDGPVAQQIVDALTAAYRAVPNADPTSPGITAPGPKAG